jgi:hypothetical protein
VPINQSLTIFIQISNRNTKFIGAWMISFGLVSGGCMFSSQSKWGKEVKVMLSSQSMRMPWRHNNQPVILLSST